MASQSPADAKLTVATSPKSEGSGGGKGWCLCSPTTHEGSFRCHLHRSTSSSSSSPWMKRSNSMPVNNKHSLSVSAQTSTS